MPKRKRRRGVEYEVTWVEDGPGDAPIKMVKIPLVEYEALKYKRLAAKRMVVSHTARISKLESIIDVLLEALEKKGGVA